METGYGSTEPGDCLGGDTETGLVSVTGEWAGAGDDLRASLDISCRILEAVGRESGAWASCGSCGSWGRGSKGPGWLGGSGVPPPTDPGLLSL